MTLHPASIAFLAALPADPIPTPEDPNEDFGTTICFRAPADFTHEDRVALWRELEIRGWHWHVTGVVGAKFAYYNHP